MREYDAAYGIIATEQKLNIPLLLYGFFLVAMIIDVGGAFGLKYTAFAIIIFVYVLMVLLTNKMIVPVNFLIVEGVLFIIAPILFLFVAIGPFSVALDAAARELTPFATWFLYPALLLIRSKEKIISFFTTAMFWGAVCVVVTFCFIYLLHFLGQGELIARINMFANEYRLGYIGRRPLVGASFFFPNVYFRWTLLLIPAAILLLQGNKTKFIFVVLAVFLSTSTAAILFLFLGLLWALFSNLLSGKISKLYTKRLILIGVIVSIATFVLYYSGYWYIIEFVTDKFNISSASTSIKVGHIKSILALMSKDVITFLFGTGVGSGFYSIGVNNVVINVEVDHFNLIRQFGILYALAFFFYVFILFIKLRHLDKTGKLLSIGLAMLFIAAGTNPLLISPIFFLLLVISRTYITLYAREKRISPKTEHFSQLAT